MSALHILFSLFLTITHVLAGAAWFGAMFYSLVVLHPRAHVFFNKPQEFERFITTISDGARWKVLGAFAVIALTGIGLLALRWPAEFSGLWLSLIAGKVMLFLIALAIFVYTSWRLWPARIFATADEIPILQRKFRIIARAMIALVGANFVLGIAAHVL